jgi:F-type H+-transporting ATPase subunit b
MPQIAQILETYASQFFWLLLVFAFLYFAIGRGMVSKIDANVDARDKKIADDLVAAERARAEADHLVSGGDDALNAARSEAQAKAATAKAKGAKDAADRLAKADAEISAKLAVAEAGLNKARSKAMDGIEKVVAEAASDIVAKVSGAKISAAQIASATKAVLANG